MELYLHFRSKAYYWSQRDVYERLVPLDDHVESHRFQQLIASVRIPVSDRLVDTSYQFPFCYGYLLEYLHGFALSDIKAWTAPVYWQGIGNAAIRLIDECQKDQACNEAIDLKSIVVTRNAAGSGFAPCMTNLERIVFCHQFRDEARWDLLLVEVDAPGRIGSALQDLCWCAYIYRPPSSTWNRQLYEKILAGFRGGDRLISYGYASTDVQEHAYEEKHIADAAEIQSAQDPIHLVPFTGHATTRIGFHGHAVTTTL